MVVESVGFAIVDIEPKRAAYKTADKYPKNIVLFRIMDIFNTVLSIIQ